MLSLRLQHLHAATGLTFCFGLGVLEMFKERFAFGCSIVIAILVFPLQVFGQQNSITTVSATPTTTTVGDAISIDVLVAGQTNTGPIPTGSVSILDGSTSLGNANLSSTAVAAPKFVSFAEIFGSPNSSPFLYSIWADLNGDGKIDLLGYASGLMQVFVNKGNGTFNPLAAQGFGSSNLALIDFDGDGKIDILMLGPTVQVAYGNGDGTFQLPIAVPGFTTGASSLMTADLTGGGLPFILLGQNAVSPSNASIAVYKNNGHGSFTSLGNFPVSTSSVSSQTIRQILPVDLNGDGKLDLTVALQNGDLSTGSTSAAILLNQGDGTFAAPLVTLAGSSCANLQCATAIVAGDFASRNKTDLAVLDNTGIELYPGYGDGTFGTAVHTNILGDAGQQGSALASVSQLIAEDINGDGKLDLVECGGYAYLGNGNFSFTPTGNLLNVGVSAITNSPGSSVAGQSVLVGDFDDDGVPDLLFVYEGFMNHFDSIVQLGSRGTIATLPSIKTLTAGVHSIVAKYAGDGNFTASTSSAVNVNVNKFTSAVSGSAAPNPALSTQSVKLSAIVTSTGPVPTGTVTFSEGSTILGTALLDATGSGAAHVTFGTAASHNVTVSYPGDAASLSSANSLSVVTVANFPSNIGLMTSPNPAVAGQPVIFSAIVTPTGSSPVPTGNVVFVSGSTQLGSTPLDSSGRASFTTSFASDGNQTITANYVGDNPNQPSSTSVVEAILAAFNFQPTGGTTTLSAQVGSSVVAPLTITSLNGFAGSVSFSCNGLPAGATCSFSPATVTVMASAQAATALTVTTAPTVGSNQQAPHRQSIILFASTLFGCIFLLSTGKKSLFRIALPWMLVLLVSTFGVVGCSGGDQSKSTTPSTYNFDVVAASGSVQQTTPFSLVVR
jgi:hypothetical protein